MSEGIPVYIKHHKGLDQIEEIVSITVLCPEEKTFEYVKDGIALTNSELEQLKREYWEAARQRVLLASGYIKDGKQHVITTSDNLKYRTFEDYEATKKDGE
jgi:hypothetical protein